MIGTTQMMSVPYALYAKSAGSNNNIDSLSQVVSNLDSLMQIIIPSMGCTDPTACNYDATVIFDNGSCSGLLGCMDAQSSNYNSLATCDDGSCLPYVGQYAYGGIVFYINPATPTSGLVCAEIDLSTQTYSGAIAACNVLNHNGYNDWRQPNNYELQDMCYSKSMIDSIALSFGGMAFQSVGSGSTTGNNCTAGLAWYWSTGTYDWATGIIVDFTDCSVNGCPDMSTYLSVRPVRDF